MPKVLFIYRKTTKIQKYFNRQAGNKFQKQDCLNVFMQKGETRLSKDTKNVIKCSFLQGKQVKKLNASKILNNNNFVKPDEKSTM